MLRRSCLGSGNSYIKLMTYEIQDMLAEAIIRTKKQKYYVNFYTTPSSFYYEYQTTDDDISK